MNKDFKYCQHSNTNEYVRMLDHVLRLHISYGPVEPVAKSDWSVNTISAFSVS